ncbi:MAG: nucleotidyltransferase domain-containing protein [Selenomonadaceae bacterium]|nr:nucleotidyltransferase domain-containing protein [Selenomonadaceae bacterium]
MNATANLDTICEQMVKSYQRIFGKDIREIYLYGSYARGDFDEESDVDFAAIVDGERLSLQQEMKKLWGETAKIDLEYDVVTSPTVIPTEEFHKYIDELPYYRNIKTEGIRLE